MHSVRLDGTGDRAGLIMPHFTNIPRGLYIPAVTISPDYSTISYLGIFAHINVADTNGEMRYRMVAGGDELAWSPDGSRLAVHLGINYVGEGMIKLVDAASWAVRPVPVAYNTPGARLTNVLGWIDNTHFATLVIVPQPSLQLASLDVTSGQLQTIVSFSFEQIGHYHFRLSPDGKEAVLYNERFRTDPFTPIVEVINTSSGRIRSLPNIARTLGNGFSTFAWKPGTEIAAATSGYLQTDNLAVYLVDLTHDTAMHLVEKQYVQAWAPDNGPLIVGTGIEALLGVGPFALSALTFTPSGEPTLTPLTHSAITFPFLGFLPDK